MSDSFDDIFYSKNIVSEQPIEADQTEQHDATAVDETPEQREPVEVEVEAPVADTDTDDHIEEDTKAAKSVPLPTFLDMRDRMKSAEKEKADLQARWDEHQKSLQAAPSIPDPLSDPRGYAEYTNRSFKTELLNQKMQMSHAFALQRHDPAEVQAAIDWAKPQTETDPNFDTAVATSADPISWIIQQHKTVQKQQETAALLSTFANDPVAAARKIAMEQGWLAPETANTITPVTIAATTQPKSAKVRPTSLTDIPAATGKSTPQSETESFNRLFNAR